MEIVWNLNNSTSKKPSILTLGTFDGVHLGHKAIIDRLNKLAKISGGLSTLITFEPHPQLILAKPERPEIRLLTTIEEKIELLQKLGLDRLVIANFTHEFATTEPELFVREVLLERLAMKNIVIGHDHAFGRGRTGRIKLLQQLGKSYNFNVEVVKPVQINGKVVSSTMIRKLLQSGDVKSAGIFLGRHYSIHGQVVAGNGRGRKLGFPTANLRSSSQYKLIPNNGVYAGKGEIDGITYNSVVSIGVRPTFNSKSQSIEVHFIDFNGSLYEREFDLCLTHRIRDEVRFGTTQELVEQMKQDKIKSQELFQQVKS